MSRPYALALFIIGVLAAGMLSGYVSNAPALYPSLVKPSFAPPGWVFGPVWSLLYIMIAIAGFLVWRRDAQALPMKLWWGQLVLNLLWSPVFFLARAYGAAFVIIAIMLVSILAFIVTAWPRDRLAALLFVPYALWVSFASALTWSIMRLN